MKSITVIILAAGLGTRMKSRKAKVLHKAGGKSLVEHAVDAALELTSPENIYVVIGHQAEQVRTLLASRGVRFALQENPQGTGHAVMCARDEVANREGRVVITYGDCPLLKASTLASLIEHQERSGVAAAAITTEVEEPTGYGRILRNAKGNITGIVEEKAATPEQRKIKEINAGIYSFDAALLWKHLSDITTNNPAREYYLTDMVEILCGAGHAVTPFVIGDPTELLGINNRVELAYADQLLRQRKTQQLMLDGVTIERPETVSIDSSVTIGPDTVIEPFVRITGKTVIGSDCHISMGAIISDSTIENEVEIGPYTIINKSHLEATSAAGPFSRLRFDNHVEAGAHVGNFVELKKTRLGRGSKAQHLAYLGDSNIGDKVNIGAGTITCNYDGRAKHKTRIGSGAFVGSNSTLVAPIDIGPGSYIAAGSTITDPIPEDALALGRSRQTNKDGWAKKRRETQVVKA